MSERELSAHSLDDKEDFDRDGVEEEDEYDEGEGENEEEYEEKGENKEYEGEGDGSKDEGDGRAFEGGRKFRKLLGWSHPSLHPTHSNPFT